MRPSGCAIAEATVAGNVTAASRGLALHVSFMTRDVESRTATIVWLQHNLYASSVRPQLVLATIDDPNKTHPLWPHAGALDAFAGELHRVALAPVVVDRVDRHSCFGSHMINGACREVNSGRPACPARSLARVRCVDCEQRC
jgi:hypothetical protein